MNHRKEMGGGGVKGRVVVFLSAGWNIAHCSDSYSADISPTLIAE